MGREFGRNHITGSHYNNVGRGFWDELLYKEEEVHSG